MEHPSSHWTGLSDFLSQLQNVYFAISDLEGRFLYLNKAWESLGYDIKAEMLGRSYAEFITPEYQMEVTQKIGSELNEFIRKGKVRNAYKKKNGGFIYFDWQFIVDRQENRVYALALDVSDVVNREKISNLKAQISEKYIGALVNEKGLHYFFEWLLKLILNELRCPFGFIGIILRDASTGQPYLKILAISDISWDEASRALFKKYKAQGMEFRNLKTLFGRVLLAGQHLMTNEPATHPAAGGLPPGHPPLHSFWGIPIYHAREMIAMIGAANREGGFHEELISLYQEIFDFIGHLVKNHLLFEELQHQRSLMSHQARLVALGELASGVGHEINNPLAIITGQISLLKTQIERGSSTLDTLEFTSRLGKMEKAASRIKTIVQGLRNLSRSETVSQNWFSFSQMLAEVIDTLNELYHADRVRIVAQIEKDWETKGHMGRWQQVLINLLNNARDAIMEGRGTSRDIHVRLLAGSHPDELMVEVIDQAGGIPQDIQQKIFQPFFTTKPVGKGTGLGLALVHTIVQEHKARLELESREGEGTTFRLLIKGRKIEPSLSASTKSTNSSSSVPNTAVADKESSGKEDRAHLSIVVLDDEEELLEAIAEMIQVSLPTARIFRFNEPHQLLNRFQQEANFDLIFTDYKMPGINGVELGERLRHAGYQGALVLMTGEVNMQLPKGFDGVLSKPFGEEELLQGLSLWIHGGQRGNTREQSKKAS